MSEAMTADDKPTERIIKLAPIGPDGRCTGCGAVPTRETGRCQCYTGPATRVPDDLCKGAPAPSEGLDVDALVANKTVEVAGHLVVHVAACACPQQQAEVARLSTPVSQEPSDEH